MIARCASLPHVTSRRAFLAAAGLIGLGALTGCTPSGPTVDGHSPAPTTPTPTGLPGRDEGLADLVRVEGVARGAAAQSQSSAHRALLAWFVPVLAAQRAAVSRGTPATAESSPSPTTPVPAIAGTTWDAFLTEVKSSAPRHAKRALASHGADSLLWASLAGCARTVSAHPGTAVRSAALVPAVPTVGTEVAALTEVVAQIHVLVFGTEIALVPVPTSDPAHDRITATWTSWLGRRDALSRTLRSLGGTVPGSRAPYDIPTPASVAAATALVATLENRFLPTAGVWVAAAGATHASALSLLADTTSHAAAFGGALQAWPGWPVR